MGAAGEHDLGRLVAGMDPELRPVPYVVAVVADLGDLVPDATVREAEGLTVVLPRTTADEHGLAYDFVAAWITLGVHSALDAVGLTAAFSGALADAGISCNVLAGLHHDHLLVPWERRAEAVEVLRALARSA